MKGIFTFFVTFFFTFCCQPGFSQLGPAGVGSATNNIAWFDVDRMSLANGIDVSSLTDFSGNGNDLSAMSGQRPTNNTNQINGLSALNFNGTSDLMTSGSIGALNGLGELSFFAVFSSGAPGTLIANSYSNGSSVWGVRQYSSGLFYANATTSSGNTGILYPHLSGFNMHSVIWNNSIPNLNVRVNSGTTANNTSANGSPASHSNLIMGRNSNNGSNYFSGSFAEFILFNEAINAAERIIIENYLAAKYNLTIANDLYAFQATHGNEVAGIGRESATDLNNDAQGTGIVRINNPSSLNDGDYLLFGHDGGALAETGSSAVTGIENEVVRSWVADLNTGDVGTVSISFDIGAVPLSLGADPSEYRLLLDDDGVFGAGTTISAIPPSGTTTISFAGVDLYSDGPYFKLAHTGDVTLCSAFFPGDWDNGTIWSCPGFPDSTNDAEIDPGIIVNVTGDHSVNNFTMTANSVLNLNAGTSLIIKGDFTVENGAVINADPSSTIIFRGLTGGQTLNNNSGAPITFGNLVINNADNVDLTNTEYSIRGGLSLTNGDLNVFANFTFASDVNAHGHLRQTNGFEVNAASYTTERFMSTRAANWNGIATAAINTTISDLDDEIFISGVAGADGFAQSSAGGGFISLWLFNQGTQLYEAVGNVNDAMPIGRGYEAWLGDNLTTWNAKAWNFNGGILNQAPTNLSLVNGWNLIGNPYAGFLDFEQIAAENSQINGGEYWHYDANNGNYGTISGAGSFVPPGQGLWLFCTSAFNLSLDPQQHLRTDLNNSNLFKLQTDEDESFKIAVKNKGEGTVFGSAVYLRKDAQAFSGVDAMDIPPLKVPDHRAINMWMDFNSQERMVNYINTDEEHIEIPLHVESGLPGQFEMTFKGLEYFQEYQCFNLLNEETGEQIEIYPEANYAFSINENLDPLSMKILISKKDYADCMAPTSFTDNEVRVFSHGKLINADFFLDRTSEADITVMNSLGQVVHQERNTVSYNRSSIDMSNAQAGIYFVNIQINGQTKTEKVILQ